VNFDGAALSVEGSPLLAARGDKEDADPSVNGGGDDFPEIGGGQAGSRGLTVLRDGVLLGLLKVGAADLQGRPVKRFRTDSLGIPRDPLFDQPGIGVGLALNGKEIFHTGEDEGRPFVP
jgi:hypothetical protein